MHSTGGDVADRKRQKETKMNVIITEQLTKTYGNTGRYTFVTGECGKHSATVTVAPNYINIRVCNAAHRAWKGMGKTFATVEQALANYRTAEIRAIIQAARDAATTAAQVAA
jgi:ribosomal protein L31